MQKVKEKLNLVTYSLSLLFRRSPWLSTLFIILIALQGLLPTMSVMASIRLGNIISSPDHSGLMTVAVFWALTFVFPGVLAPIISTLQSILNQHATYLTQRTIMEAACRIEDLKIIEKPDIHDNLEVLSREAAHRPLNLLVNLVDIFRGILTLLSLSLVLASVVWWFPLAFLLPLIPITFTVALSQIDIFRALLGKGTAARLIRYYLAVLLDVKLAKEVRIFRSASFFFTKHTQAFEELENELNQVRRKQLLRPQPWNLLYLASILGVMYWFVEYLQAGRISVGGLLGTIQSISFFGLSCQWMVYSFANIGVCFSFFARLRELESVAQENSYPLSEIPPLNEIKFENVSFSYENGHNVLSNINLTIHAGDHLSIVGENGAGKSTLIKLLCRLYHPTSGRITWNGIDVASIDIRTWHRCLSAIFQDFGHYNMTVQENVTFRNNMSTVEQQRFLQTCEQAQFPLEIPHDATSFLGKEYSGTELSGGQWQRLALARALFSDGELIILDEPTSATDPRVETELFARFSELVRGRTSVMVTHRLSAVKNSTRIIVLKQGEIVESGTPAELEIKRGEYYALLNLQRSQYDSGDAQVAI
ncbi:ABC transporter ATP-binding protein [Dickeya dadantii]|uniref:ABC transporter ATP-binding protein n=1 Tax=Dickeya dadantii TaxID=204038 RepID=UPI001495D0D0|nr:ABC transporter ATP-binding protein [Dickeya dadantii]NPE56294.1 ABC transporter ATP-binding protein [Dickeya dadantii]NPE66601.1 ABC transporter ATP-binding protein [Dickeya dadantii]